MKKRLLQLLYHAAVIPLILMFVLSSATLLRQEILLRGKISDYVSDLAGDAARCYDETGTHGLAHYDTFLEDAAVEEEDNENSGQAPRNYRTVIPGRVALMRRNGEVLWSSNGGKSLSKYLDTPSGETLLFFENPFGESALCLQQTQNEDIVAVAAVSLHAWMGGKGVLTLEFALYAFGTALLCLLFLKLQKRWLLLPLQHLMEEIHSLRWGQDVPRKPDPHPGFFRMEAAEVTELRQTLTELAEKAIEKESLQSRYTGDLVKTQEEERKRVAREIHDGPIQIVTSLIQRIQMSSLASAVHVSSKHLALAEEAAQLAVEDLRGICDDLSPPWLSLGLGRCLEELAERLGRQYGIFVETQIEIRAEHEPGPDCILAFFRICQEGVSNAVRHGHATAIAIRVRKRNISEEIALSLWDNGVGFQTRSTTIDQLRAHGNRGLAGIAERTAFLCGRFSLRSTIGRGTVLSVAIPSQTESNKPFVLQKNHSRTKLS